jgi:hypothetical protein
MISTQPGSTPLASFKVVSLDEVETQASNDTGNNFGNFLYIVFVNYTSFASYYEKKV